MRVVVTHVAAIVTGAALAAGGAAAYASSASRSTAAYPCPTRTLAARVACLENSLLNTGPGGSGSILAAREAIRNWCVFLLHQPNIDSGSDAVSILMRNWKLSCGAFRH